MLHRDPYDFERSVKAQRKAPLPREERLQLIRSLPEEGHVRVLDPEQTAKVRALTAIFEVMQRQDEYHVQIFEAPQAFLGLHERTIVLLSINALNLLEGEELMAMAAHQAGHEFFWEEYAEARSIRSEAAARRIELLADAVAVLALQRLGIDARTLIAGIRKLCDFNATRLGTALNTNSYPKVEERARQIQNLSRRLSRVPMREVAAKVR